VQRVRVGADGKAMATERSAKLFDPGTDPLMDKGARDGAAWWFTSFTGNILRVDGKTLTADAPWSVKTGARDANWRPGGGLPLALHRKRQQLFVLMHKGGVDTHKQSGTEVWVFDLVEHKRVSRIVLKSPASSIDLSQDDDPLLFAVNEERSLDVYAINTGKRLRRIDGVGIAPIIVQSFNPGP
jgi:methylamine dehydrogenase heavy chain